MSAQAFIAFLRTEAQQAEERARSLRATAAAIEANAYNGGGVKKRKSRDPNKPKRQATAYTMFVSENYEHVKNSQDPPLPGKDIIALIARQWSATSEEEKQLWKERALQSNQELPDEAAAVMEEVGHGDPDQGQKKKAATQKASSSAAV